MKLAVDKVYERSGDWYATIYETEEAVIRITIEGDTRQIVADAAAEICRKVNRPE